MASLDHPRFAVTIEQRLMLPHELRVTLESAEDALFNAELFDVFDRVNPILKRYALASPNFALLLRVLRDIAASAAPAGLRELLVDAAIRLTAPPTPHDS